jgi:hypothetical protein
MALNLFWSSRRRLAELDVSIGDDLFENGFALVQRQAAQVAPVKVLFGGATIASATVPTTLQPVRACRSHGANEG